MTSIDATFTLRSSLSDADLARLAAPGAIDRYLNEHPDREFLILTNSASFLGAEEPRAKSILRGEPVEPPTSALERLKVALYGLAYVTARGDLEYIMTCNEPGVAARCQQMLTDVMLEHPILMSPKMAVHTHGANDESGVAPLAHAIVLGRRTRFPTVGDAGVDSARLRAWVDSKHVQAGLLHTTDYDSDELPNALRGCDLLHAAAKLTDSKAWVIVSLDGLWALHRNHGRANGYAGSLAPETPALDSWPKPGKDLYARSLRAAIGVCSPQCEALLESAKAGGWLRLTEFRYHFAQHVLNDLLALRFASMGGKLTFNGEDIGAIDALQRVIAELLERGLCTTGSDAANLFTTGVPMTYCTPATPEQAVAMLRVLVDVGGPECLDAILTDATNPYKREHMAPWKDAARIFATEASMTRVIDRAAPAAAATASSVRRSRTL